MNVAEYIAEFLVKQSVNQIFVISGAANLRMLDAIHRHPQLEYICPHHEQAGAIAAITYFRTSGKPGVMMVTAGPGGTNAITGIASAYLDSIPILILAGQEKSEFMASSNQLRGKGVQGLDMVQVVSTLTKYAVCVTQADTIRYHLERAFFEAYSGRPGPVWIEIPQDIQSVLIDPTKLQSFDTEKEIIQKSLPTSSSYQEKALTLLQLLKKSTRPLIWAGHGLRLSRSESIFNQFLQSIEIPVLTAWNAADLLAEEHPLYIGRAGIYGHRAANFAVQNCDLLIALGTRLSIPQIGYSQKEFARSAKKVIVEIDKAEIDKWQEKPDLVIHGDVKSFLMELIDVCHQTKTKLKYPDWKNHCKKWKEKFPPVTDECRKIIPNKINSYHFIDRLSDALNANDIIVTDMGTSLTCTHAAIRIKQGQRLMSSTALGEMGFGLPGAIGACFANEKKRIIFIGTEGSLQMNIQELQTVVHHQLPIKFFILNNNGYLTIQHTERAIFGSGRLSGCTPETGISFPDFSKLVPAYGLIYKRFTDSQLLDKQIATVLNLEGPVFVDIMMPEDQFLGPKIGLKMTSSGHLLSPPLEDLYPFLSREELKENMIIPLLVENEVL